MKNLLLLAISLPLLLGGCGGTTEINSESQNVNVEELMERKEIVYLKGTYRGYTGKAYELHPNGQKAAEFNYKNGKFDGLLIRWDENGNKYMEWSYKNGEPHGLLVDFYENGQKFQERRWRNGERVWDKHSSKQWNRKGEPVPYRLELNPSRKRELMSDYYDHNETRKRELESELFDQE